MKELYAEISRVAKLKQVDCEYEDCDNGYLKCPDCYGRGGIGGTDVISDPFDECISCDGTGKSDTPCPTCATLKKWAELEWHETRPRKPIKSPAILQEYVQPCSCGVEFIFKNDRKKHIAKSNRTLDIPELVTMLKELGEWDNFSMWFFELPPHVRLTKGMVRNFMETCTTPDLFRDAVLAYLKEVK